jgi:hypothetical protein
MMFLLCDVSIDLDPSGGVVLQKPAGGGERPPVCGEFPYRRIFVEITDDTPRFQMNGMARLGSVVILLRNL